MEKSTDCIQFLKVATVAAMNSGTTNMYNWFDANPVNGFNYYRIKSIEKSGRQNLSQIVKVNLGNASISIVAYPNPLQENRFNLQLNNLPKGKYSIIATNSIGQEVLRKTIDHNGGSSMQMIELDNKWTMGTYQLEVVGENTKLLLRLIKQ